MTAQVIAKRLHSLLGSHPMRIGQGGRVMKKKRGGYALAPPTGIAPVDMAIMAANLIPVGMKMYDAYYGKGLSHFANSPINSRLVQYSTGGAIRHPKPHYVRPHISHTKYGIPVEVQGHMAAGARRRPVAKPKGGAHTPAAHFVKPHMSHDKYGMPIHVRGHMAAGARRRAPKRKAVVLGGRMMMNPQLYPR
jgi:hypothetical protein